MTVPDCRRTTRHKLLLLAGALAMVAIPYAASATNGTGPDNSGTELSDSRVLILHADNVFLPANRIMDSIIAENLIAAGIKSGNIHAEYIEEGRFTDPGLQERLRSLMADRYRTLPVNLAFITDDTTLDYMTTWGDSFLPDTIPLVLCGISANKPIPTSILRRAVIVYKRPDTLQNLSLITRLLPETETVHIFAGNGPHDRFYRACAQADLSATRQPFDIAWLEAPRLGDILETVKRLPPKGAILALSFYEDAAGNHYNPRDAVKDLVAASPLPVFGITESYGDSGFVGGYLMSFSDQAREAARMAIEILGGAPVHRFSPEVRPGYVGLNHTALVRWDIPRTRIPPGSTIVGETPSFWSLYQREIVAAFIVFILGTGAGVLMVELQRRKKTAERLARDLRAEREALLRELHHRTKNNMQVISSLLNLYARREGEGPVRLAFSAMKGRIAAMALVHDQLYNSRELDSVAAKPYLEQLVASIQQNLENPGTELLFVLDLADEKLPLETAVPLGILVNELVVNSVCHGFSGRPRGRIGISLEKHDDGTATLGYHDDGQGLPEGFDAERDGKLGFQTLSALIDGQLKGSMKLEKGPGFHCSIRFSDQ